jgi:hypothetical protein
VLPVSSPLRHDQLLLAATCANLVLVFFGFVLEPAFYSYDGGALLGLVAAIVAAVSVTPVGRAKLDSRAS